MSYDVLFDGEKNLCIYYMHESTFLPGSKHYYQELQWRYPMLKYTIPFLMIITAVCAQKNVSQDEINLRMCGEANYSFDESSKECVYCAHGLKYNEKQKCVGTPDVLGKCYGDHHYHAATQECMFCALGYTFNETSRQCVAQTSK
jgi:hypothetical protein